MDHTTDYHNHTLWSDGKNSPAEVVEAGIRRGLRCIGISDHSHTGFDERYCMKKGCLPAYRREIAALRAQFAGKIEVLCGIEQDYFGDEAATGFDFVIGSVHYIRFGEDYVPVDETPDILKNAAIRYCGGDLLALAEAYFDLVGGVADKTGATIIGHFDLITKFNEKEHLFDADHPRYRAAWQAAADRLLMSGAAFEQNTGAITRGYRTTPYPSEEQRDYLLAHGARFVFGSDTHRV